MQEFKNGDLVQVKQAEYDNWYNLGEVYKIRSLNPWLNRVFVESVEGEFYSGFTPAVDNDRNDIWIDSENLDHVIDPEIEEFLINLEMLQKAVEDTQKEDVKIPDEFKVGDRVVISPESKLYGINHLNPTFEGTVISTDDGIVFLDLKYEVRWDNDIVNFYRAVDLQHAVEESDVITLNVTFNTVEESLNIIFEPEQIAQAAVYLSENNPYIDEEPEFFENEIYKTIKRNAGKYNCSGYLGFYALFSQEGNNVDVTVLVDPALGTDRNFVEATLKDGKLFQEF